MVVDAGNWLFVVLDGELLVLFFEAFLLLLGSPEDFLLKEIYLKKTL